MMTHPYDIRREPLTIVVGHCRLSVQVTATRVEGWAGHTVRAWLRRADLAGWDVDVWWSVAGLARVPHEPTRDRFDDALRAVGRELSAVDTLTVGATTYPIGRIGDWAVAWDGHVPVARRRPGAATEWLPPPAEVPGPARSALDARLAGCAVPQSEPVAVAR